MKSNQSPSMPVSNLEIGSIIEVDGPHIVAELNPGISDLSRIYGGEIYAIGQFGSIVKIHSGIQTIYGFVTRLRLKSEFESERGITTTSTRDARVIEADLFGEGQWFAAEDADNEVWRLHFERGVATFPLPQQRIYLTPSYELRSIYGQEIESGILIGEHVGAGGAPAFASLNELVGKHTAILGSTGSGKSSTVAAILHSILETQAGTKEEWRPNILVLDPHNEYGAAFPGHKRLSTDEGTLRLPYWLFGLQETIGLLIGKTEFVATSQANIIKNALLKARRNACKGIGLDRDKINVDSPVPYKWEDFSTAISEEMPPQASRQDSHLSILAKLETLRNDSRMDFMMEDWGGADDFATIFSSLVGGTETIRVVDLSGIPNEVAGIASAVIARALFSFKVWQNPDERDKNPVLVVCEEAHRYVPNSGDAQYEAAQEAVRRIAKEGRKYGIGLFLISQRPSEIDATVLSQCSSWIVLRLSNETDRSFVRGMLPDSLAGLVGVVSGLRQREAIVVGQATLLPSRVLIRELQAQQLPRSHDVDYVAGWKQKALGADVIGTVALRWRYQTRKP